MKTRITLGFVVGMIVILIIITSSHAAKPMVSVGGSHTVGLKFDGTVVATPVYHSINEWDFSVTPNLINWNSNLVVDFGGGRCLYNYDTSWH